MLLRSFRAENYRNIKQCDISFSPGVNLLSGDNAQGKTNALECIYLFARGKSFRSATDADLTKFGESGFSAEIFFQNREREQTLSYSFEDGVRRRHRNGVTVSRLGDMLGHFRAVLFYPEHLQIIKGGPAERRDFLNVAIAQNEGAYMSRYAVYNKILENRNFLLKMAQKGGYIDREELLAWSEKMADTAASIYIRRKKYIDGFIPFAQDILRDLSGDREKLTLRYTADTEADTEEEAKADYITRLTENLTRECAAGCSLYGVHRDDIEISVGGKSVRSFGSQGQQRSAVLAMKLAEGEYSRSLNGEYPVYLFDDVLSELDAARRAYVLDSSGDRQLILTACDKHFECNDFNEIRVEGGTYVSSHR